MTPQDPDRYRSIKDTCERFSIGKSTFYRMLADPDSGLVDVVRRVPPVTGRLRVPERAFEEWVARRNGQAPPERKPRLRLA